MDERERGRAHAQMVATAARMLEDSGIVSASNVNGTGMLLADLLVDAGKLTAARVVDAIAEKVETEERSAELHADLNRRAALALGKPFEGEGSSWHDIPECITVLRAERDLFERRWKDSERIRGELVAAMHEARQRHDDHCAASCEPPWVKP